jgi:hypothetical protein
MQAINAAKYHAGNLRSHAHLSSHAGFHFLLDYVPDWKRAYDPYGLIQYQSFIPKETAEAAFAEQIRLCQKRGIVPYLAVFKRHRPDPFLMTHAVDGYSLEQPRRPLATHGGFRQNSRRSRRSFLLRQRRHCPPEKLGELSLRTTRERVSHPQATMRP